MESSAAIKRLEKTKKMTKTAAKILATRVISGEYAKIALFDTPDGIEWEHGPANRDFKHNKECFVEFTHSLYRTSSLKELSTLIYLFSN
jgi:hypothetical protein